jgi:DNA-binding beta-propeller fold protein YncE
MRYSRAGLYVLVAAVPLLAASPPPASTGGERRLYVATGSGLSVHDISNRHRLLRKIELPESGNFKGIAVSIPLGRLYVSSNKKDEVIAVDLLTEKIVWRKKYGEYADSMWMMPDGKTFWLPCKYTTDWYVIDAATGDVLTRVTTERGKQYETGDTIGSWGPHNTWSNPAGTRVYLSVLTVPYLYVADAARYTILQKIGPFARGIRPFAVSDDERYVFANVDALLGFEVADVKSGKVIHRVVAKTPAERLPNVKPTTKALPHSTPSHGINITPDQKEVWVVDGKNGYVFVYDVTRMPPVHVADVPLFATSQEQPKPGWLSFSIEGDYAYPSCCGAIDTRTRRLVDRFETSEKLLEVQFVGGKPVKAGHR